MVSCWTKNSISVVDFRIHYTNVSAAIVISKTFKKEGEHIIHCLLQQPMEGYTTPIVSYIKTWRKNIRVMNPTLYSFSIIPSFLERKIKLKVLFLVLKCWAHRYSCRLCLYYTRRWKVSWVTYEYNVTSTYSELRGLFGK